MCKMASFWHNPINGDISVYALCGHSETQQHLKLNEKVWREGHYTPSGEIECRVIDEDRTTMAECNERLRIKFPTFKSFLSWALAQSIGGSLYLSGCDLKGITLPQSIGGYLDLRGDENGYKETIKQFEQNKNRTSCAKNATKETAKARKLRTTHK